MCCACVVPTEQLDVINMHVLCMCRADRAARCHIHACVVHVLCMCCAGVVHVLCKCCACVVHMLCMCCAGVVQVLCMCCACVVHFLPYRLLICKLQAYGLSVNACELLKSYFCERKQRVKLGDKYSE